MSVAPFGLPVVPLVYWMSATSSALGRDDVRVDGGGCRELVPGIVPRTFVVSAARDSRALATGSRSRARIVNGIARVTSTEMMCVDRDIRRERLDGLDDLVPRDDDLGAVVLELVAQLARRVERVVLDDDRAEPQHRVERDDVLRAVRQHERDRVALLHAEQAQPLGGALDLVAELGVGGGALEELERDVVGILLDRRADEVVRASPRERRCRGARPRRSLRARAGGS